MDRIRYLVLINFIICVVLGGVAFYYNAVDGVTLCPLCSMQLICYYIIGVVSLVRFVYIPERAGHYAYGIFLIIFSVLGILFGNRQLWMQHLPNYQSLSCSPDIIDTFGNSGLSGFFHTLFNIYRDCSSDNWQFLNLSMVTWSLIGFAVLIIIAIILLFTAPNEHELDANIPAGKTKA